MAADAAWSVPMASRESGDRDRGWRVTDSTKAPTMHPCLLKICKRVTQLRLPVLRPIDQREGEKII